MLFFKSVPNLPDHEKARVEFHLQQLAECLGPKAMRSPVLVPDEVFGEGVGTENIGDVLEIIGRHLEIDVTPIKIQTALKSLEVCGGGG